MNVGPEPVAGVANSQITTTTEASVGIVSSNTSADTIQLDNSSHPVSTGLPSGCQSNFYTENWSLPHLLPLDPGQHQLQPRPGIYNVLPLQP